MKIKIATASHPEPFEIDVTEEQYAQLSRGYVGNAAAFYEATGQGLAKDSHSSESAADQGVRAVLGLWSVVHCRANGLDQG